MRGALGGFSSGAHFLLNFLHHLPTFIYFSVDSALSSPKRIDYMPGVKGRPKPQWVMHCDLQTRGLSRGSAG